jgi:two-component sensor histidine kinase
MAETPPSSRLLSYLSSPSLEHAPLAIATVDGATHVVRYANLAFCQLIGKAENEIIDRPFGEILPEKKGECLPMLDRIYRTGKVESHTEQEHSGPRPVCWSFTMWPVTADERIVAVMIQVIETAPLYERTIAINEALLLGALRQHELAAAASSSATRLQMEVEERRQRERDAQILTNEISHRIKNSLQIVVALIAHEVKRAASPCVQGYEAMQARIGAIADLYDLMSQSRSGRTVVPVDEYLREITETMSASLLGENSRIKIEVKSESFDIDPDRAVPFGLLVNELAMNAIKHAFPGGAGIILVSVERTGDEIELTVADNGVGMNDEGSAKTPEKHGSDYVAIFVRQLGGTMAVSGSAGAGTMVRIRLPLLVVPPAAVRA